MLRDQAYSNYHPCSFCLLFSLQISQKTEFGDPDNTVQSMDLENKVIALLFERERAFEFFSLKFG